jgi:hypothetical protein
MGGETRYFRISPPLGFKIGYLAEQSAFAERRIKV